MVLLLVPATAVAMPVQFFYVPFPEDQLLDHDGRDQRRDAARSHHELHHASRPSPIDTIIYYDQWENGYDIDIANTYNIYTSSNPGGTQIWGDGNLANGAPPGGDPRRRRRGRRGHASSN